VNIAVSDYVIGMLSACRYSCKLSAQLHNSKQARHATVVIMFGQMGHVYLPVMTDG